MVTDGLVKDGSGDISILSLDDMDLPLSKKVAEKYNGDKLRWASKPLLLMHLLNEGFDKVIYVDNDIYFYSSPDFLFKELDEHAVLLTPHYYLADPSTKQYWLEASFRIGLYNAGFIGVNKNALEALDWWGNCCAYNVKKAAWRGLFDDQKYLDLMPVLFDHVEVLKHKGCNVAGWNLDQCPRSKAEDGTVLIDNKWPLVFVHFNGFTMRAIMNGADELLAAHLETYFSELKRIDPSFDSKRIAGYNLSDAKNYLRHIFWNLIRLFD